MLQKNNLENALILCVVGGVLVANYFFQSPIQLNEGLGWDGRAYASLAEQFSQDVPVPSTQAPWVYRIGHTFLAGMVFKLFWGEGFSLKEAFQWVNYSGLAVSMLLLLSILRFYKATQRQVWVVMAFTALHFGGSVRFQAFDAYQSEPWANAFLYANGLLVLKICQDPSFNKRWGYFWLTMGTFWGMFFREYTVIPAASLLIYHLMWNRIGISTLPVGAGLLSFGLVRMMVVPNNTPGGALWFHLKDALYHLTEMNFASHVMAFLVVFGPFAFLVVRAGSAWFYDRRWLFDMHPIECLMFLCHFTLILIGGTDLERYWLWAAPLYVLAALQWQGGFGKQHPIFWVLFAMLFVLQLRLYMPIPEPAREGFGRLKLPLFGPAGNFDYLRLWAWHSFDINYLYASLQLAQYLFAYFLMWLTFRRPPRIIS